MNYETHFNSIKTIFPKIDLIRENEFHLFENNVFVLGCVDFCINLCNNASKKLKIPIYFGIKYDYSFNAKAFVTEKKGVIIFNLGLIENLEKTVVNSFKIFSHEIIAQLTVHDTEKVEQQILLSELSLSYLFHHELAHILQLNYTKSNQKFDFQEKYSSTYPFDVKNHIYEFDADYFGALMSSYQLIVFIKNKSYPIKQILIFNLFSAFLFCISNIIILFSKNHFKNIFFKNNSHPHPAIRIQGFYEQTLSFISDNLVIQKEALFIILQRVYTMINQVQYDDKGQINLNVLIKENYCEIEKYVNEIETLNDSYSELIRFRSEEIFNCLVV